MHPLYYRCVAFVFVYFAFVGWDGNSLSGRSLGQDEPAPNLDYPSSKAVDQVDDYHGQKVEDPFRWLEDVDSSETKDWVKKQNELTFGYLKGIPERESLVKRLGELWNYERYGFPTVHGTTWVVSHNNGLQNQNILYKAAELDAPKEVLLDPNTLSSDGTTSLAGYEVSSDGKWLAYGLAKAGSDWNTWKIRNIETGSDLVDTLDWIKFSTVAWTKDNAGFFYSRYDQPKTESEFTGANYFQKLYYHKVGTPQSADLLVYERSDEKEWGFRPKVSDDGAFLIVAVWRGTERKNQIFYAPIQAGSVPVQKDFRELLSGFLAEYEFLGNDGDLFYFETDRDAPKRRIIAIDRIQKEESKWKTIVPESAESIEGASLIQDQFFVTLLQDATSVVRRYQVDGTRLEDLPIPGLGTVTGFEGKRASKETFFSFTNTITPPAIYRVDLSDGAVKPWREPKIAFDPKEFVTERTFYTSKDGTRIPLILSYKKGFLRDGNGRAFLYAYGGFNISITPTFSPANLAWMEQGGVYAVANIRGGGEYGREWHESAMLDKKQNCFDDFIAAAEYLIANRYTNRDRLAVHGRSNGGLLIGAVMTQRPDLFAVALPAVGVMDMLRFQKFTIGWAWVNEFGSSDDPKQFSTLFSYSPLHNLRPGTRYPATMVTTADHDDRVVPGHSFKFAARLQACQSGSSPALIRIETSAGHGAGTPVSKLIEAAADMWAFVLHNTREPSKP